LADPRSDGTLCAPQNKPEKHRHLIVRVAGCSHYFSDLTKALEDEIIGVHVISGRAE
jgi:pyruvate-formate lyase